MSKLSFRARALDTTKPMPVLRAEDVPDLPDFAAINRAVPQMPTGMEKEEECEHHLQRAMSAQQAFGRSVDHVIPTPEVFPVNDKEYDKIYPPTFKFSRQYIHLTLPSLEKDQPEYDMDSEDEGWFNQMQSLLNITETRFEEMIECLERNSSGQKVIDLSDAKLLLQEDEGVIISVYDYWLNKKLNVGKSLIPTVKTERRDGTSGNNPYIAFRRRTEKMQTRKNRKNDESSYAKMIKLKRDFLKVCNLMEMLRKRELTKNQIIKCTFAVFDKRYELCDFEGQVYKEIVTSVNKSKSIKERNNREKVPRILTKNDENLHYKKRRDGNRKRPKHDHKAIYESGFYFSDDEENTNDVLYQSSQLNEPDEANNPDGIFAFKRKKGCNYFAPVNDSLGWAWEPSNQGGLADKRYQFNLTSLSRPPNHFIGHSRRRIGRGGRIIFDRIKADFDDSESNLDDFDIEWPHYASSSSSYLPENYQQTIDFNAEYFTSEDFPTQDKYLINFNQNKVFKYNKNQLLQFMESRNQRKNGSPPRPEGSGGKRSPTEGPNNSNSNNNASRFASSIDTDVCNSILSSVEMNAPTDNSFTADDMKLDGLIDFNDSDVNTLDMLIHSINDDNIDLMLSPCEKNPKFETTIATSSENNNLNNGSDYFSSDNNNAFSCEPSTTSETSPPPSTSNTSSSSLIDAITNVSSQNNSTTYSSHCKLKLTNSQNSNFHQTDVT